MRDGERARDQYDAMAAAYAQDNDRNAYNAAYERPATIALLGDVAGRRVLEVGCGAGPLTRWLVDHGATVTATDVSPAMVQLARAQLGDRVAFHVSDLADGLPFAADASFELVVASLVLHYVRDWHAALHELRRVVRADGAVVFSTHHPAMDWQAHSPDDYFAVQQVTEVWTKASQDFEITFWRRPLTAMAEAITSAGFLIQRLVEPQPLAHLEERDPKAYADLRRNPRFLFFRLVPG